MKKVLSICGVLLLLALPVASQQITLGPFNAPPIDPSLCTPDSNGQTVICFAKDGVHVSIAGGVFGGALCDSSNPACEGPQGNPGQPGPQGVTGPAGPQGVQGPPGVIVGSILTGNLKCPPGKGNVATGFTITGCVFTVTAKQ